MLKYEGCLTVENHNTELFQHDIRTVCFIIVGAM